MNWIAQTGHVAAKDVRHARWSLIAYLAMLGTAAYSVSSGQALGPYWTSPNTETLGMRESYVVFLPLCTVLLGLVVTASLVQMDSPTRATAFWASRPLSPSAVLMSKISLVFFAIIALPLLGEFIALRYFDANAAATAGMLAHVAASYVEWLLAAMVIGALTDDLQAFVGAFVVVLTALIAALIVLPGSRLSFGGTSIPGPTADGGANLTAVLIAAKLVTVAAGLALLAFIYRTHDRRRRVWAAGAIVAALLVLESFVTPPSGRAAPLAAAGGPPIVIEPVDPSTWGRATQLQIRVSVPQVSDSVRLIFQADTISFETHDGAFVAIGGRLWVANVVEDVLPPVGQSVRWIVDRQQRHAAANISYEPNPLEQPKLAGGVKSVMVGGVVTVFRPHIVASLPLREGAIATINGQRLSIYGFSHSLTQVQASVNVSEIANHDGGAEEYSQLGVENRRDFAMVNSARGEAVLLGRQNSGGSSGSIILPWMSITSSFMGIATDVAPDDMGALPKDDAWYAGARLVVVEWTKATSYRTSAQVSLP